MKVGGLLIVTGFAHAGTAAEPLIALNVNEHQTSKLGKSVPQDHVAAVKWLRKAAEQGHARAQTRLGNKYRDGQGVRKKYATAMKWWRRAAAQNDTKAMDQLANVGANNETSLQLTRLASIHGHFGCSDNAILWTVRCALLVFLLHVNLPSLLLTSIFAPSTKAYIFGKGVKADSKMGFNYMFQSSAVDHASGTKGVITCISHPIFIIYKFVHDLFPRDYYGGVLPAVIKVGMLVSVVGGAISLFVWSLKGFTFLGCCVRFVAIFVSSRVCYMVAIPFLKKCLFGQNNANVGASDVAIMVHGELHQA